MWAPKVMEKGQGAKLEGTHLGLDQKGNLANCDFTSAKGTFLNDMRKRFTRLCHRRLRRTVNRGGKIGFLCIPKADAELSFLRGRRVHSSMSVSGRLVR